MRYCVFISHSAGHPQRSKLMSTFFCEKAQTCCNAHFMPSWHFAFTLMDHRLPSFTIRPMDEQKFLIVTSVRQDTF